MKKIAILLFVLLFPVAVFAQDTQIKADMFEFAPDIKITEPVSRDLVVVGGKIEIADKVEQDVFAAGGTINILADVAGDVMAAGTRLVIDSEIQGNVSALAQTIEITENANILGSMRIKAETVIISGNIQGNAQIDAYELEQTGIIAGELNYKKIESKKHTSKNSFLWFFRLIGLFGMLIVGLILVSIWPKAIKRLISGSIKNPLKDFAFGIAALIATPIIVLVLMLTIIGFPLALILVAAYLIALYLAQILTGIILGTYLFGAFKGRDHAKKSPLLAIMIIGVIVLWLITGIPVVGGLLKLIAIIWGLGILINLELQAFKKLES